MKRPSRYDQLDDSQRRILRNGTSNVIINSSLSSYLGPPKNVPFFEAALSNMRRSTSGWATESHFVGAFVNWCNGGRRQSARTIDTGARLFSNGFAKFIVSTNRQQLSLSEMDSRLIRSFCEWLQNSTTKNGGRRSENTQRKQFGLLKNLFEVLKNSPGTGALIAENLAFPTNPFNGAENSTKRTDVIDDDVWFAIISACRADIAQIVDDMRRGRKILDGPEVGPDQARRGRGKYARLEAALWELKKISPAFIPSYEKIRTVNRNLSDAIQYIHGKTCISRAFYPTADDILPFILLQSIYTSANTGSLRALKWSKTKVEEVMGVKRVKYTFIKPRMHSQYSRSFALQDNDMYSPYELNLFLKEWTDSIRKLAGKFRDNIYIFVTHQGVVRGFNSSQDVGTDSDSTWQSVLKTFLKRHGLPKITIGILRMSGLDMVREQSGDDIRSVMAAGGQNAISTIDMHYEGPGAKRRRHEGLAEVMITQERWLTTGGSSDPRTVPDNSSIGAATPGWSCLDPFDSPICGEQKGRLCQAFGQCPACPMGSVNINSAYSLARVLQLSEEIHAARFYLEAARWESAFEPALKALQKRWIPSFKNPTVLQEASGLTLGPIGRLE